MTAGRRRIIGGLAVSVALVLVLVVAVVRSEGFRETRVDLNDAGVWVVNHDLERIGRLNTQLAVIEVAVTPTTRRIDVEQVDSTVLLLEPEANLIRRIDVALGVPADGRELPSGSSTSLGGPTAAVLEPTEGNLFVTSRDDATRIDPSEQEPATTLGAAADMVVGDDGTAHGFSPEEGALHSVDTDGLVRVRTLDEGIEVGRVTAVGAIPVVLDEEERRLFVVDGTDADLSGHGADPVLQLPGQAADSVLVATDEALLSVDLDDGTVEVLDDTGTGGAAAPVRLGACLYAAWSGQPRYAQLCEQRDPMVADIESATIVPGEELRFRVNRDRVVLNQLANGANLLFTDREPILVDNWNEAADPNREITQDPEEITDQSDVDCDADDMKPPKTNPVQVGTRPGRPVIVRVLANDQVDGCDVPVVEVVTEPPEGAAQVAVVDNGTAIQVSPTPDHTEPIRFTYGVSNALGGDLVEGEVTVEIVGHDVNRPPDPSPDGVPPQETTVTAGGVVRHDVLLSAIDPDGDALTLVGVRPSSEGGGTGGTVNFRADGEITFRAGGNPGTYTLAYDIVDERGEEAEDPGELTVRVTDGDNTAPNARNIRAEVVVGAETVFDPLANDDDPDGDELELSACTQAGSGLTVRCEDGELTLLAAEQGTWRFSYAVTDGQETSQAVVRVDARDPEDNRPPVAVRDDVVARVGVPAAVNLVANDIDPDGDVLGVIGIDVPSESGLAVELIDLHLVRVTAPPGFDTAAEVRYTVSDGQATSEGVLVVRPYLDMGVDQPPLVVDDAVSLRAGTVTRIPVLENDVDPEGDRLELIDQALQPFGDPESTDALGDDEGFLFVYDDELRYEAPAQGPVTVETGYTVADPGGNVSTGRVTIRVRPDDPEDNRAPRRARLEARVFAGSEVLVPVPLVGLDPDGDPVALLGVAEPPGKGTVDQVAEGFVYFADRTASGVDAFEFRVRDTYGLEAVGRVDVVVLPPRTTNANPVAVPDRAFVQRGESVDIPVLANDRDPDGDTISLLTDEQEGPTQPREGRVDVHPEGDRLIYTAPDSIDGDEYQESFSYGITDGRGGQARGVVTVTVTEDVPTNQRPIARDDFVEPQLAGETVVVDVLGNDEDPDGELDTLVVTVPSFTGATVRDDDQIEVTVERSVAFRYEITDEDGDGLSSWALVVVPVLDDLPPRCRLLRVEATGGETTTVPVLDACTDPAGADLELVEVISPRGGSASLDGNQVAFTPQLGVSGDAGFSFVVSNGAETAVGAVQVQVAGENAPPVFTAGTVELPAGGERIVDLDLLVDDPDPVDTHTFTLERGSTPQIDASLSGSTLTVTASNEARGATTSLELTVTDGVTDPVTGTLPVRVLAHDRPPPVAVDDSGRTTQGRPVTIPVTANDIDPLGEGLVVSLVGEPSTAAGTARVEGETITFTPDSRFYGMAQFTYEIRDGADDPDRTSRATVRVNVIGYPDAPAAPTGTAASRQVSLRWGAPPANGAPITGYKINRRVEGQGSGSEIARIGPATAYTDTSVANGTRYQYQVLALNEAVVDTRDEVEWSAWSAPVQPDELPDAPGAPRLTFGDREIRIDWDAPANAGAGSPLEEYEVRLTGGFGIDERVSVGPSRTSHPWRGLTNGTRYTFAVRARNDAPTNGGWGEWSGVSTESPAGRPAQVGGVVSQRLDEDTAVGGALQVSWAPLVGAEVNAEMLDSYTVEWWRSSSPGSVLGSVSLPASALLHKVYDLENGVDYTFSVRGVNKAGDGSSGVSLPVRPAARPVQVARPSAVPTESADGRQVRVTFAMPADNGDGLTDVLYSANGGGWQAAPGVAPGAPVGSQQTFTVGGLSNGTPYGFRVRACNSVGSDLEQRCGVPSEASPDAVPYGAPAAPSVSAPTPSGYTISWSWSANSLTGGSLVGYQFRVGPPGSMGSWSGTTTQTSHSQSFGCGQTRRLEVRVINTGAAGNKTGPTAFLDRTTRACPSITVSQGDFYPPNTNVGPDCTWSECPRMRYQIRNFAPGRYTLTCHTTFGAPPTSYWSETIDVPPGGDLDGQTVCVVGSGHQYWVTMNGVESNRLNR